MADIVLKNVLHGRIELQKLFKWLLDGENAVTNSQITCNQSEFILYFLNLIHEENVTAKTMSQTPVKLNTPKRLKTNPTTFSLEAGTKKSDPGCRRRVELFPDLNKTSNSHPSTPKAQNQFYSLSTGPKYEAHVACNYMSPVSPLYNKNTSFSTPKSGTKKVSPKSTAHNSVSLADFIIQKNASSKKKAPKEQRVYSKISPKSSSITVRRINPTSACTSRDRAVSSNSFNFRNTPEEVESNDLDRERSLLCEQRLKIVSQPPAIESTSIIKPQFLTAPSYVKVALKSVTFVDKLDVLVEIYTKLLDFNLVLNFTSELYFIVSLLVAKQSVELTNENSCSNLVAESDNGVNSLNCFSSKSCGVLHTPKASTKCKTVSSNGQNFNNNSTVANASPDTNNLVNVASQSIPHKINKIVTNTLELDYPQLSSIAKTPTNVQSNPDVQTLLSSVHNCVYFAAKVLSYQVPMLAVLDRTTINLLKNNQTLRRFNPNAINELQRIYNAKVDKKLDPFSANIIELETNVCFISDTDNRENFPSDPSFHAFRKQRDLFYEILRLWDKNHMLAGWKYDLSLGGKIRTLLNLHTDPANFMHLARLFKSQLLSTCCRNKNTDDDDVSEQQLSFLSNIPNMNAEKLSKLKDRLVTKNVSNGIVSLPTFPGTEEFYKDFLVIGSNPTFTKHLTDIFVHEILELNDTNFVGSDLDESGSDVDPSTRKSFALCLKSLRILAKFVGFIESLPYRTDSTTASSEHLLSTQIRVRYQTVPAINIKQQLLDAIKHKKLTMSIPWITTFLAMLDFTSLRLPYYHELYEILFEIYYNCKRSIGATNIYNTMVIKLCLGWLFELPNFPENFYISWLTNKMSICASERSLNICWGNLSLQSLNSFVDSPQNSLSSSQNNLRVDGIDDLGITDDTVLYLCCPYLVEIKTLLCNDSISSRGGPVKHITPVTSAQSATNIHKKQLEMQLEEAFFNGQPISMRKTVEFVSERVASTCVKHICNEIVPQAKKDTLVAIKRLLGKLLTPEVQISDSLKKSVTHKVHDLTNDRLKCLRDVCDAEVKTMCHYRISNSIVSLLASDVLKPTSDACVAVATRMSLERVDQWTMSHVTSAIFARDSGMEIKKAFHAKEESGRLQEYKPSIQLPSGGKDIVHNPNAFSPVKLMEEHRALLIDILEKPEQLTTNTLLTILDETIKSAEQRCDLNSLTLIVVNRMFIDLILFCVSRRPDILLEQTVYKRVMHFLKTYSVCEKHELFKRILCPRNVMILSQSKCVENTWKMYAAFLVDLLKEDLLSCKSFEKQCLALYKEEWHESIQKRISTLLQDVVDNLRKSGKLTESFDVLITWLADYCSELDV